MRVHMRMARKYPTQSSLLGKPSLSRQKLFIVWSEQLKCGSDFSINKASYKATSQSPLKSSPRFFAFRNQMHPQPISIKATLKAPNMQTSGQSFHSYATPHSFLPPRETKSSQEKRKDKELFYPTSSIKPSDSASLCVTVYAYIYSDCHVPYAFPVRNSAGKRKGFRNLEWL